MSKRKDNRIECEYWEDIEITDPMTGNKVVHKVKVTRYKSPSGKSLEIKPISEELGEESTIDYSWDFSDNDIVD